MFLQDVTFDGEVGKIFHSTGHRQYLFNFCSLTWLDNFYVLL